MFTFFRLIIAVIVAVVLLLIIRHKKIKHGFLKGVTSFFLAGCLLLLSFFFPLENLFINFSSSVDVYKYLNFGNENIKMVLKGNDCDLVVGDKNNTDVFLMVPKGENGYKIANGINTKMIKSRISDSIVASLYQYDHTNDFFLTVTSTNSGECEVVDIYNSKFFSTSKNSGSLNEQYFTYYAYIGQYEKGYFLKVNGRKIEI